MLLLIIVLILVFGFGGYRVGGPDYGPFYGGGGVGLVLLIVLILWATGNLTLR